MDICYLDPLDREIIERALEAIRAAVNSGCQHDTLETDDALEQELRRELIDIAHSVGINNAETLCDFAYRVLQEGQLTHLGD
jgi:hypothetical protein